MHDVTAPAALPAGLREDLAAARGSAFFLTRRNVALSRSLETLAPHLDWTRLSKEDVRGWGPRRVVRAIRARPFAVLIIEDEAREGRRRIDLYRTVLFLGRGGSRWLLLSGEGEAEGHRVSRGSSFLPLARSLFLEGWHTLRAAFRGKRDVRRLRARGPAPARTAADNPRVAFLKTDFWFGMTTGGAVTHALELLGGMRNLGLTVRVWSPDPLPAPAWPLEQEAVPPPARPALLEDAALVHYNRFFLERALDSIRAFDPGLIYHRHGPLSVVGLEVARRLGVPLVLEMNSSETQLRRASSRLLFSGLGEEMEATVLGGADRILVVSDFLVPIAVEAGASPDRLVVNPNGADPARFRPLDRGEEVRRRFGFAEDAVVCGYVGSFAPNHGTEVLARVIPTLAAAESRLRFLFLGEGDLRPAVEAAVRANDGDRVTRFAGAVAFDRIPEHLAACDILLSPYLPFEDDTPFYGSPTKIFEYMAAGRAVVSSALGQASQILDHDRTGLLVPAGDEVALRAAVLELAADPERRARLGRAARETAETRYTWTANARRAVEGFLRIPAEDGGS